MKVTDQATYRLLQTNLNRVNSDLTDLRYQGATGLRLNKPSDDPGAIRPVLSTQSQIRESDRYIETMGRAADKMAATDIYLEQIENTMVRAKEIAITGANDTLSASDFDTLANEVAELQGQLLNVANASVDGKYIFAGYSQDSVPFTENPAYDPAAYDINDTNTWPVLYNGDHHPTLLEITPGEYLEANVTGNELFLGITNEIAANGSSPPYQGQSITSGSLSAGPFVDDISITVGSNPAVTLAGAAFVDAPLETNYAGNVVAFLFNQPQTGLVATANPATADLGPLDLTGFDAAEGDSYNLSISSGGNTVNVTLDGSPSGTPPGNYDYTLEGLAYALANTLPTPTNLTSTSGTLSNGVIYDISSGSLVLTGPDDGSEIDLAESIIDNGAAGATGGITGSSPQTIYGTINLAPNSTDAVQLANVSGLANLGLTEVTLDGADKDIDLFTVLKNLEEALSAGNIDDPSGAGGGIQTQIDNLDFAADQNREYRSIMGSRAARVDTAMQYQEETNVNLQSILSRYQDADILEVYNDILQKENAFTAALNITARISEISILNYF